MLFRGLCMLLLAGATLNCSQTVALQNATTCDGGNVDDCRSTCDQNKARSCYRLGWFYEEGEGVGQNMKSAVDHYNRACDNNLAVACRALGILYWEGERVDQNRRRGLEYFQRACGMGLPEACPDDRMLAEAEGRKYYPGDGGVKKDDSSDRVDANAGANAQGSISIGAP